VQRTGKMPVPPKIFRVKSMVRGAHPTRSTDFSVIGFFFYRKPETEN
jgi:hypothetical protein